MTLRHYGVTEEVYCCRSVLLFGGQGLAANWVCTLERSHLLLCGKGSWKTRINEGKKVGWPLSEGTMVA